MISYYLKMAMRSQRRMFWIASMIVLVASLGVATSTLCYGVLKALSGDPIPSKSGVLYVPQLDVWSNSASQNSDPPSALTYTDAMALLQDSKFSEAASFQVSANQIPLNGNPRSLIGYAVSSNFFSMLSAPYQFGQSWSEAAESEHQSVVVISAELNNRIFGGENSVGKILDLDGKPYRIAGVLAAWDPQPRFYDTFTGGGFDSTRIDFFAPITTAFDVGLQINGNMACRPDMAGDGRDCAWISMLVELSDKEDLDAYSQYLESYLRDSGAPPGRRVKVWSLPEWLDYQGVVPKDVRTATYISGGLLVVCLANVLGLLLENFMTQVPSIGIRRALGARRMDVLIQLLVEAGLLGAITGVASIVIALFFWSVVKNRLPDKISGVVHLDFSLFATAILASVVALAAAAIYPAWKATKAEPAITVKQA